MDAASVQLAQFSCLRRLATWCLTPGTESPSSSAMILFVAPSASCSIACSRELSRTESGLGELPWRESCWLLLDGESSLSCVSSWDSDLTVASPPSSASVLSPVRRHPPMPACRLCDAMPASDGPSFEPSRDVASYAGAVYPGVRPLVKVTTLMPAPGVMVIPAVPPVTRTAPPAVSFDTTEPLSW